MARGRKSTCRLCMKPITRGDSSTLDNLPKTFAHILEEMSGIKFTQADGLQMKICVRCRDFLQAMENHSSYPRANKISGAGKRKVRRLMDKGFSPSEAIDKVTAEKRARDLLAGARMSAKGATGAPARAGVRTRVVRAAGQETTRLAATRAGAARPGATRAGATRAGAARSGATRVGATRPGATRAGAARPGATRTGAPRNAAARIARENGALAAIEGTDDAIERRDSRPRMSGAQRKKLQILIAGGMDRITARELVLAASRARASNIETPDDGGAPSKPAVGARGALQRKVLPRVRATLARGASGAVPARGAARRVIASRAPIRGERNAADPKGAPRPRNARERIARKSSAPLNDAPPRQGASQRAPPPRQGASQRAPPQRSSAPVNNQDQRPANSGRTRDRETDRRAPAPSRRNERPAPYENRRERQRNQNNNNSRQQTRSLDVGIVPINFPNVHLDDMKLEALKDAITNEIFKIPPGGPLVRFLGTSSQNGWLKLTCADEFSHSWLSKLVARWERAGVCMVEGNNLPQNVVLTVYLPNDFRSPDEILSILDRQNNSLNTNQWRIVNRETDAHGQTITVCVDEQSFQALKSRDFSVFLGLGVVELTPRRFPSDGGTFNNSAPMQQSNQKGNNNRSNFDGGNNSHGYSNGNSGGGHGGNNYQSSNRSNNNSGGGNSYQRHGVGGQNYQRSGYQAQRSW